MFVRCTFADMSDKLEESINLEIDSAKVESEGCKPMDIGVGYGFIGSLEQGHSRYVACVLFKEKGD